MANLPAFTETFHRDTYPAISPLRPELSTAGKVVIVTGAAGKIGKATCKAFAQAGAQHVAMLDLDEQRLQRAKAELEKELRCKSLGLLLFPVDITDQAAVKGVFSSIESEVGKANVLVNNAGYQPSPQRFRDAEIDEWWTSFEVNVKGSFIVAQEFIRYAAPAAAASSHSTNTNAAAPVLINISSVLAHWGIRQGYTNRQSAYSSAKIAFSRAMEVLQEEEPWLRVVNVHPGLVATPMAEKSGTLQYSLDSGKYHSLLLVLLHTR